MLESDLPACLFFVQLFQVLSLATFHFYQIRILGGFQVARYRLRFPPLESMSGFRCGGSRYIHASTSADTRSRVALIMLYVPRVIFFSFISVANLQDEIRVTSFWHLSLFSLIELSQLHHVFDSKTGTTMMSFNNSFSSWDVKHHCWTFLGTTVHSGGQQTTNCSWLYSLKTRIVN